MKLRFRFFDAATTIRVVPVLVLAALAIGVCVQVGCTSSTSNTGELDNDGGGAGGGDGGGYYGYYGYR